MIQWWEINHINLTLLTFPMSMRKKHVLNIGVVQNIKINKMSIKSLGFDELIGKKILSFNEWSKGDGAWSFKTDSGDYTLKIDDEGYGCNDSHAFLESIVGLEGILNQTILKVDEVSHGGSSGETITLETAHGNCVIEIIHEHNGYYGFSYELVKNK